MTGSLLRMPRLGETMEEGKLVAWLVEPGKPFDRGEPIVEVETDKTIVEFPALGPGVLTERLVELGATVSVGDPIALVDVGDGPDWTLEDGEDAVVEPETANESRVPPDPEVGETAFAPSAPMHRDERLRATPVARRIARRRGIDLATVSGTGRRGRIEHRDVASAGQSVHGLKSLHGIAYHEDGPADGAQVLFLHGFAADHSAWAAISSQLAKAGRHTIAADLPGHGQTALEACDVDALTAPFDAFVSTLGCPLHLIAHSLGAVPAVALASKGKAASLTLIAPAGLGHSIDTDFVRGLTETGGAGEIAHLLARMTDSPIGLSDQAMAEIARNLAKGRLKALADSILGARGQAVNIRAGLAKAAKTIPVRLILGHRDRIIDWRESLDVSPRIAVHHLPRVGHMPHWEALGDVLDILKTSTESI